MSKTVLVTGATGAIAGAAIPQLLEKGFNVRAYVRNPQKAAHLKEMGAEIIEGDFSDVEKLTQAAAGADMVLSINPPGPEAALQSSNITNAAKNAGVQKVIRISAIGAAADAPTENGRLHHAADTELMNSGLNYTILRPNFFMQNVFMSAPTIMEQGNMYWGMGDGKIGMIDVRDVADCCVSLVADGGHDNAVLNPGGPSSIGFAEVAQVISHGVGKPVNYVPVPVESVGPAVQQMTGSEWFGQVMMDYSRAYSQGWGDFVNDDVQKVTGHPARSFQQFYDEVMGPAFGQQPTA